jgi:hypothetical protein
MSDLRPGPSSYPSSPRDARELESYYDSPSMTPPQGINTMAPGFNEAARPRDLSFRSSLPFIPAPGNVKRNPPYVRRRSRMEDYGPLLIFIYVGADHATILGRIPGLPVACRRRDWIGGRATGFAKAQRWVVRRLGFCAEPICFLGFPIAEGTVFDPVPTIFRIVGLQHLPILRS